VIQHGLIEGKAAALIPESTEDKRCHNQAAFAICSGSLWMFAGDRKVLDDFIPDSPINLDNNLRQTMGMRSGICRRLRYHLSFQRLVGRCVEQVQTVSIAGLNQSGHR